MAGRAILNRLRFLAQLAPPGQIALRDGEQQVSFPELVHRVSAIARRLLHLNGSVVAFAGDNSVSWILLDLACQVAELTFVPLPDFFTPAQTRHCIESAGVDFILADTANLEIVRLCAGDYPQAMAIELALATDTAAENESRILKGWQLVSALEQKEAVHTDAVHARAMPVGTSKVTFTSGSTGTPKGVCLSAAHQWQVAESLADTLQLRHPDHLCLLPLATLLENVAGVYTALLSGGTVILASAAKRGLQGSSHLDGQVLLSCLDREQPNSLIVTPQLLTVLVSAAQRGWRPPKSLQFIAVGGARVASELIKSARASGLPVYEGYGLSECGSVVSLNTPAHDRPGTTGLPLGHCRIEIVGGEIRVHGSCHLGFLQDPQSWHPHWIDTGDLGNLDKEGFLSVTGRRKNLLVTSYGRNISPEWVESTLLARPLLSQCVVLGDGCPALGAVVSAPPSVSDHAIQQWLDQANQSLPDYARVQQWLRIPGSAWSGLLTANGRPRRAAIADRFAAQFETLPGVSHRSVAMTP